MRARSAATGKTPPLWQSTSGAALKCWKRPQTMQKPPAIDRLRGIIDDDQQQPQQHIAAARAVLEYGLRLVEANDFEQRLRALEERSRK